MGWAPMHANPCFRVFGKVNCLSEQQTSVMSKARMTHTHTISCQCLFHEGMTDDAHKSKYHVQRFQDDNDTHTHTQIVDFQSSCVCVCFALRLERKRLSDQIQQARKIDAGCDSQQ